MLVWGSIFSLSSVLLLLQSVCLFASPFHPPFPWYIHLRRSASAPVFRGWFRLSVLHSLFLFVDRTHQKSPCYNLSSAEVSKLEEEGNRSIERIQFHSEVLDSGCRFYRRRATWSQSSHYRFRGGGWTGRGWDRGWRKRLIIHEG